MKKKWIVFWVIFIIMNIGLMLKHYPSLIIPVAFLSIFYILIECGEQLRGKNYPNIKLSLYSFFIILCIIEIVFWSIGFLSTYAEKNENQYLSNWVNRGNITWYHTWTPNVTVDIKRKEFNFVKKTNSIGIIGDEFPLEKDSNEFRIIFLGDSFTEGVGVPFEASFPQVLQQKLSAMDSLPPIRILGAGVSGSDIVACFPLLRDQLMQYQPDLVISIMNSTDYIQDIPIKGGLSRFQPDSTVQYNAPPFFEPLYASSRMFRIVIRAMGYNENLLRMNGAENENRIIRDSAKEIRDVVDEYIRLLSPKKIEYAIFTHPLGIEFEIDRKHVMDILFEEINSDHKIEIIDLKEVLIEEKLILPTNYETYFWPIDKHHNQAGYEKLAEAIRITLLQKEFIPQHDSKLKRR